MFKKAVKHESKLRMAIAGPSGSGKTYTALAIASGLGENIAFLDTEHGSASKYADIFDFDVVNVSSPFHPDKFIDTIKAAGEGGYDVLIIDSLSHAWNGLGGLLELVNQFSKKYKGNSYVAWGEATPIQDRFIEAIVSAEVHIIGTMRSKQDYILVEGKNGKTMPQKVGMAPIQRDGFEYEFDIFSEMDIDHNMIITKSRCLELSDKVFSKPSGEVSEIIKHWLTGEKLPELSQDEKEFKAGTQSDFFQLLVKHINRYEGESQAKAALKKIGITSISKDWATRFANYKTLNQYALYRDGGMDEGAALDAIINGTPESEQDPLINVPEQSEVPVYE